LVDGGDDIVTPRRRRPTRRNESKLITSRGGSRRWSKITAEFCAVNPVCWLRFPGCTVRATTIDHYHPRKYRPDLAEVPSNFRPACGYCNRARGTTPPWRIDKLRAELEAKARPARALGFFR
jgi:5-methylcytosine-specific restriction endonuclease McrA